MNRVFIHSNNLCNDFENRVLFSQNMELDKYISEDLLKEIEKKNPQVIFIKDALSEQYIDLLGLRVAMHIRISNSKLKLLPIVIISELSLFSLVKLSSLAKILFTKNVFLVNNTKKDIENFDLANIPPFNESEYKTKFLNLIEIEPPKDYLSHHSIANEWSIYKWATALAVSSESTRKNKEKIHNMLYFKYLVAKDNIDVYEIERLKTKFKNGGKIVAIDDELDNGWHDIFKHIFKYQKKIQFRSLSYDYQDKSYWAIKTRVLKFINEENPDVVILDLRLAQNDHEENINIEEISGMKLLQEIHKINAGIQVIMLTATSRSTILEKLYEYKILGYVKKEHPDDRTLNTKENIEKFISLVEKGLENSYLKKIYIIKEKILKILLQDPFSKNIEEKKKYEEYLALLIKNTEYIFDILNTSLDDRFNYVLITITTSLEAIVHIFLQSKDRNDFMEFWDGDTAYSIYDRSKLEDKLIKITNKKFTDTNSIQLESLIRHRNNYVHSNKNYRKIKEDNICEWFETMYKIVQIIDKDIGNS